MGKRGIDKTKRERILAAIQERPNLRDNDHAVLLGISPHTIKKYRLELQRVPTIDEKKAIAMLKRVESDSASFHRGDQSDHLNYYNLHAGKLSLLQSLASLDTPMTEITLPVKAIYVLRGFDSVWWVFRPRVRRRDDHSLA